MRARIVARTLIETDSGDEAAHIGAELDSQFHRLGIAVVQQSWCDIAPTAARTDAWVHRNRDPPGWGLDVSAIIDRPASEGSTGGIARRSAITPVVSARPGMPTGGSIHRSQT